jgi:hypothetical protein
VAEGALLLEDHLLHQSDRLLSRDHVGCAHELRAREAHSEHHDVGSGPIGARASHTFRLHERALEGR